MILIAAADKNWGIGNNNSLLVHIPADQKFFRETTTGNVVIMGRRTLESLPGGRPLKDRENIVLSSTLSPDTPGITVVKDIESLLSGIGKYPSDKVFCIGGAAVYKELLPYCDRALITRIDNVFEADAYLPDLDSSEEWELTDPGEEETYFDLIYHFTEYRRISGGEKCQ